MILVTGARGYIGSFFINKNQNNYDIKKFSLQVEKLNELSLKNVDTILHCAALVHQKQKLPYIDYKIVNIDYPLALAKKAKEEGVKQFIFISSIAVYGDNYTELDEDTKCKPTTYYGKSKLRAEEELLSLQNENFIISIIRPPMVYGKDAPGNIKTLIKLITKISILPFGKINNKRSFIFIENLIGLIDTVIDKKKSGIFLASDDKAISTTYLVELITQQFHKKSYLIKLPFLNIFLKKFKPSLYTKLYDSLKIDNSQTKKKLNYSNPYSVEEGIKKMLEGK